MRIASAPCAPHAPTYREPNLTQVKSEKVVLSHYIDFATVALKLANTPMDDFDAALTKLFDIDKDKHAAAYCNGILRQVRRSGRAPPTPARGATPIDLSTPTIV